MDEDSGAELGEISGGSRLGGHVSRLEFGVKLTWFLFWPGLAAYF
jgi:hypothetical protein